MKDRDIDIIQSTRRTPRRTNCMYRVFILKYGPREKRYNLANVRVIRCTIQRDPIVKVNRALV